MAVNRNIRRDINTAHRNITELATLGEFVICWEDTEYQTYQVKRLNIDTLLQRLQQCCVEFIRPGKIDTLLAVKSNTCYISCGHFINRKRRIVCS